MRRAIGATRRHIRLQFLTEAATLSTLGGIGGVALGCAVTAVYARRQDVPLTIPFNRVVGGVAAALVVGAHRRPLPGHASCPPRPGGSPPPGVTLSPNQNV